MIQIKALGTNTEVLLDSDAAPNLISEQLCDQLLLKFDAKTIGLTVADG